MKQPSCHNSVWDGRVGCKKTRHSIGCRFFAGVNSRHRSWASALACECRCVCVRACAFVRGHRFNWVRMSRRTGGQECCQWCRSYTNYRSAPAELDGRWTSWDPTSLPGRAPSRDRHCQEKKLQKKRKCFYFFRIFSKASFLLGQVSEFAVKKTETADKNEAACWNLEDFTLHNVHCPVYNKHTRQWGCTLHCSVECPRWSCQGRPLVGSSGARTCLAWSLPCTSAAAWEESEKELKKENVFFFFSALLWFGEWIFCGCVRTIFHLSGLVSKHLGKLKPSSTPSCSLHCLQKVGGCGNRPSARKMSGAPFWLEYLPKKKVKLGQPLESPVESIN